MVKRYARKKFTESEEKHIQNRYVCLDCFLDDVASYLNYCKACGVEADAVFKMRMHMLDNMIELTKNRCLEND